MRLINRSDRAGTVRITAIDDSAVRRGPMTRRIGANAVAHFDSGNLERGNESKGLAEGTGVDDLRGTRGLPCSKRLALPAASHLGVHGRQSPTEHF